MAKPKKATNRAKIPLDTSFGKRDRGRPKRVPPAWVRGCADSHRHWLEVNWNDLSIPLLRAQSEQEITNALQSRDSGKEAFLPLSPLILRVLKSPNFPKRNNSQIKFLADSIAGGGTVSPRRSRDICAKERAADVNRHSIVRYEYWIECSCGYQGRSENHGCKKCGAVLLKGSELM
jgi:hypothetical protein